MLFRCLFDEIRVNTAGGISVPSQSNCFGWLTDQQPSPWTPGTRNTWSRRRVFSDMFCWLTFWFDCSTRCAIYLITYAVRWFRFYDIVVIMPSTIIDIAVTIDYHSKESFTRRKRSPLVLARLMCATFGYGTDRHIPSRINNRKFITLWRLCWLGRSHTVVPHACYFLT